MTLRPNTSHEKACSVKADVAAVGCRPRPTRHASIRTLLGARGRPVHFGVRPAQVLQSMNRPWSAAAAGAVGRGVCRSHLDWAVEARGRRRGGRPPPAVGS